MSTLAIVVTVLTTFVLGLYLGHRWATHDDRIKLGELERRYQKLIRFAEASIEAEARRHGRTLIRNDAGAIVGLVDKPIRCGTPALLAQELLEERRRRDAPE